MKRRAGAVLVVLALALLAGGCSLVNALVSTDSALTNAGYTGVSTNISAGTGHGSDGTLIVAVNYRPSQGSAICKKVARVVWDNTPARFSFLEVRINNYQGPPGSGCTPPVMYSHKQLLATFHARPDHLDATPLVNIGGLVRDVVIGGVTALLLVVGVTLLIVWLVRRSKKRKQAALGGALPGYGAYPGPGQPAAWYPPPAPGQWGTPPPPAAPEDVPPSAPPNG